MSHREMLALFVGLGLGWILSFAFNRFMQKAGLQRLPKLFNWAKGDKP
jgi:hypothetical protein